MDGGSSLYDMDASRLLPEFGGLLRWKKGQLQKALRIASAEDGVRPHQADADTFIVDSDSANCRIVDVAVCECSCPNPNPPCSHLLAVALWQPQQHMHQLQTFRLRLAISTFVKQQLLKVLSEAFVPLKPLSCEPLLEELCMRLLRRHPAAVAARAAAGLVVGLLLRFAQNAKGVLPQIPSTEGGGNGVMQTQEDVRLDSTETTSSSSNKRSLCASSSSEACSGDPAAERGSVSSPEEAVTRLMQYVQLHLQQQGAATGGSREGPLKQLHALETSIFPASDSSQAHSLLRLLQRDEARAAAAAIEEALQWQGTHTGDGNSLSGLANEAASIEIYVQLALLLLEASGAAAAAGDVDLNMQQQWLHRVCLRLVQLHFSPAAASSLWCSNALSDAAALSKFLAALRESMFTDPRTFRTEESSKPAALLPALRGEDEALSPALHNSIAAELQRQSSSGIRLAAALCNPWRLASALAASFRYSHTQQQQGTASVSSQQAGTYEQCLQLLVSQPESLTALRGKQRMEAAVTWQSVAERIATAPELVELRTYLDWSETLDPLFGSLDSFLQRHGHAPFRAARNTSGMGSGRSTTLLDRSFFLSVEGGGILRVRKATQETLSELLEAVSTREASTAVRALAALLGQRQETGSGGSGGEVHSTSYDPMTLQIHICNHLRQQQAQEQQAQEQQDEQQHQAWGDFCCRVLAEAPRAFVDGCVVILLAPLCEVFGSGVVFAAVEAFNSTLKCRKQQRELTSLEKATAERVPSAPESGLLRLLQTNVAFNALSSHLRKALQRCVHLLLPPREAGELWDALQREHYEEEEQQQQQPSSQHTSLQLEHEEHPQDFDARSSSSRTQEKAVPMEQPVLALLPPSSRACLPEPSEDGDTLLLFSGRTTAGLGYFSRPRAAKAAERSSVAASHAGADLSEAPQTVAGEDAAIDLWNGESPAAFVRRLRAEEFGVGLGSSHSDVAEIAHEETAVDAVMRRQRERLTRALGRLAGDLYAAEGHLQLELLQNADDNTYVLPLPLPPSLVLQHEQREQLLQLSLRLTALQVPALHFEVLAEGLCVFNNERGFRPADLRALCDVARSTKAVQEEHKQHKGGRRRIGKFGVGFKSVFSLADDPHVFSCTGVAIKFSATDKSGLGFVLPHPLDPPDPSRYVPSKAMEGALLAAADPVLSAAGGSSSCEGGSSSCCCGALASCYCNANAATEAAIGIWRTIIWLPVRPALLEKWQAAHSSLPKRLSVVEPHCLLFLRRICRVSCRSQPNKSCFLLVKHTFQCIDSSAFEGQQQEHQQQQRGLRRQTFGLPKSARHVVLTSRSRSLASPLTATRSCDLWSGCTSTAAGAWKQQQQHWLLVEHLAPSAPVAGAFDEPLVVALPLTPEGYAASTSAAPRAAHNATGNGDLCGSGTNDLETTGVSAGWPLYCFLPVRGFGLPFILQGAFSLTASREDLQCSDPWNARLLQQLPAALCRALSVCRDVHPELQESLLRFVPLPNVYAAAGGSAEMVAAATSAAVAAIKDLECVLAVNPHISDVQQQDPQDQADDCVWCSPARAVIPWGTTAGEGGGSLADIASGVSSSSSRTSIQTADWPVPPWLLHKALGLHYVHPRVLRHLPPARLRALGMRELTLWDVVEILRFLVALRQQQHQVHKHLGASVLQPQWVGRLLQLIECIRTKDKASLRHRAALGVLKGIPFIPTRCGNFVSVDGAELTLCLPDDASADPAADSPLPSLDAESSEAPAEPVSGASSAAFVLYVHPAVFKPWSIGLRPPVGEAEELVDAQLQQQGEDTRQLVDSDRALQRSCIVRCLRNLGVDFLQPQQLMRHRLLPLLQDAQFRETATDSQLVECLSFFVLHYRDLAALIEADRSSPIDGVRQRMLSLPVCVGEKGGKIPLGAASMRYVWPDDHGCRAEARHQEAALLQLYRQLLPEIMFLSAAYDPVIAMPTWKPFCELLGLQRLMHISAVVYQLQFSDSRQHHSSTQQPALKIVSVDGYPVPQGCSREAVEDLELLLARRWRGSACDWLKAEVQKQAHWGDAGVRDDESVAAGSAKTCVFLLEDFLCPDFERLVAAAATAAACSSSSDSSSSSSDSSSSPASWSQSFLRQPLQRMRQLNEDLRQAENISLRLLSAVLAEAGQRWQRLNALRWWHGAAATSSEASFCKPHPLLAKNLNAAAARARWLPKDTPNAGGTAASSLFVQLRCSAWLPAVACDALSDLAVAAASQEASGAEAQVFEIDCEGDDVLTGNSSSSSDSELETAGHAAGAGGDTRRINRIADGSCTRCNGRATSGDICWQWRFVGLRRPFEVAAPSAECVAVYGRLVEYLHPLVWRLLQDPQQQEAPLESESLEAFASLARHESCRTSVGSGIQQAEKSLAAASHIFLPNASSLEKVNGGRSTESFSRASCWLREPLRSLRPPGVFAAATASNDGESWTYQGIHCMPDEATAVNVLLSLSAHLNRAGQPSRHPTAAATTTTPARSATIVESSPLSVAQCFLAAAGAACKEGRCCCERSSACGEGCGCLWQHAGGEELQLFCCCCSTVAADFFELLQYLACQRHSVADATSLPGKAASNQQSSALAFLAAKGLVLLPQPATWGVWQGENRSTAACAARGCCIRWMPPSQTVFRLPVGAPLGAFVSGGWPLEDLLLLLLRDSPRAEASISGRLEAALPPETSSQQEQRLAFLEAFLLLDLRVAEFPPLEACIAALVSVAHEARRLSGCAAFDESSSSTAAAEDSPSRLVASKDSPAGNRLAGAGAGSVAGRTGCTGSQDAGGCGEFLLPIVALLLHVDSCCRKTGASLVPLLHGLCVIPCLRLACLSAPSEFEEAGRTPVAAAAAAGCAARAPLHVVQFGLLPVGTPLWLRLSPSDCRLWESLREGGVASAAGESRRGGRRGQRGWRGAQRGMDVDPWGCADAASAFSDAPHVVWCCDASCDWEKLVAAAAAADCSAARGSECCCRLCGPRAAYRMRRYHGLQGGAARVSQAWLELLQQRLGAESLHSVCSSQLTADPPFELGERGRALRGLEVKSLCMALDGQGSSTGYGLVLHGLKQRLLAVLLPAVRRFLLHHDPSRYVELQRQWLARQNTAAAAAAGAPAPGRPCWLQQVQRLLILLCRNLRRTIRHMPSGAVGRWDPCPAALQWEGLLEGEGGELPVASVVSGSSSTCGSGSSSSHSVDAASENRWETDFLGAENVPLLLAWNVSDEALGSALVGLEAAESGGSRSPSRAHAAFDAAYVDRLQELLLPSLPGEVFGEFSRLFSLTGKVDASLSAFLLLLYAKAQHRLLQWLLRPPSCGILNWLRELQRGTSVLGFRLWTVAAASIVGAAVEDHLAADCLWTGGPLDTLELQQQCLAEAERRAWSADSSSVGAAAAFAGVGAGKTADTAVLNKQALLTVLKEEAQAAENKRQSCQDANLQESPLWLLRDAWFVLTATDGVSTGGSGAEPFDKTAESMSQEEMPRSDQLEGGEAIVVDSVDGRDASPGVSPAKKRRPSEGVGAAHSEILKDGEGQLAAREHRGAGSSCSSSSDSSESETEEEAVMPTDALGWTEEGGDRVASSHLADSLQAEDASKERSREEALFGSLHPFGKASAYEDSCSVDAEGKQGQSRQGNFQETQEKNPVVALGEFEAQAIDLHQRDRDAAEPFLAGPSTNTSKASTIAARRGEALVYMYLQRQLQQQLAAKTAQVVWLNEEQEGGQSYDILIQEFPPVGSTAAPRTTFVEVKSSSTADKRYFEISHREWNLAQQHGNSFHIYRVLDANSSNPQIFRIVNPYLQWKQKRIGLCIAI
ncbi:uncharacterized protein LOC34617835 [Cyclospora cayetanensis]|uniref:Uncharacterized protein LOC34617835 n=1 Tax=Cyclospora cayetanensis TaxID=88456 RepID=A0A6P6S2R3_9EIME|nr:uncharacterized protein LOC34617835 [Cyclospora cayetanensis]